MCEIHQKLKMIREGYNLSQAKFSEPLGLKQPVYQRYEKGGQSIPYSVIKSISIHYRVNSEWLLKDQGEPYKPNELEPDMQWKRLIILRNRSKVFHGTQRIAAETLGVDIETYKKWEMGLEPIPEKIVGQIYAMVQTHIRKDWWYEGKGEIYIETYRFEMPLESQVKEETVTYPPAKNMLQKDILDCITQLVNRTAKHDRAVFGELLKIKLREVGVLSAEKEEQ